MVATQKLSCRYFVGPSLPRPTLFYFGLVWSNHIAGKMYPEMDIRRTVHRKLNHGIITKMTGRRVGYLQAQLRI